MQIPITFAYYWWNFPIPPSSRLLAALLVRWLALIFQKGEKLHFHAPIEAHVFTWASAVIFPNKIKVKGSIHAIIIFCEHILFDFENN